MHRARYASLVGLLCLGCAGSRTLPVAPAHPPEPPPVAPGPAKTRPLFEGQSTVTLDELLAELDRAAGQLAESPALRRDYEALLRANGLEHSEALLAEYVRVRIVFEATRDGGLWGLSWAITNREGNAKQIWKDWQESSVPSEENWGVTAVAECDELSALFAFLARRLGVKNAGWLGGGRYHIIAAWTAKDAKGRTARIVVPTSQVFLGREASLGTREIDPYRPKVIWNYWPKDLRGDQHLPADLARYFVEQVIRHVGKPQAELQARRNRHGGS